MKVARLKDIERIAVEEANKATLESEDHVLIQIKVVTICGSDVHYFKSQHLPHHLAYPLVLGHEAAGVVRQVGRKVTHLKVGDRVAIEPSNWCGKCYYCRTGRYNFCEKLTFMASKGITGALREYVSWPAKVVFKLPDNLSFKMGALLEPLSVAYSAMEKLPLENCSNIAIIGAGSIGMLVGKLISIMYPQKKVCLIDLHNDKKRLGERLGLKKEQFLIQGEYKNSDILDLDALIDTTGNTKVVNTFMNYLRYGGTLVQVGVTDQRLQQTFKQIVYKGLCIIGSYRYANTYPKLISLLKNDDYNIAKIITHNFHLSDVQKAFEIAQSPRCMKVSIIMDK
ncbi:alcohol dehydrogenase catalytic domain-containing protein [Irregularibacter muris]|uniref:Alcohol dehydrogenase catalytic domain-containing protein n=1 Tax=Irregularibacter muris TaxID=1796619 RepID=A0AAE3HHM8_9FIRM|nr:alcohol dehydrogenase catalytic domain-containing protein [Irregularibacter muris]MCR1899119.1 alcohol dehydrogenase catalytic domain-containing protein [Irregularibacter muris]